MKNTAVKLLAAKAPPMDPPEACTLTARITDAHLGESPSGAQSRECSLVTSSTSPSGEASSVAYSGGATSASYSGEASVSNMSGQFYVINSKEHMQWMNNDL